ncbi:MAG: hypothetical protein M1372_02825 [Patescibacteria group bacterium]|nr:hypothetical protein [Patescibacteria group bacterium]
MTTHEKPNRLINIRAAEMQIAERLGPTPMRASAVCEIFDIPQDVHDLTIVDLAAGTSSFVPYLLEQGANAYAVDRIYDKPESEIQSMTDSYTAITLDKMEPEWRKYLGDETRKAVTEFWKAFHLRRDHFVTAWLSEVPLPDDFADITTSLSGITAITLCDFLTWESLISEALRITRPQGRLLLSPLFMVGNDKRVFDKLSERKDLKLKYRIPKNVQFLNYPVLEITKQ